MLLCPVLDPRGQFDAINHDPRSGARWNGKDTGQEHAHNICCPMSRIGTSQRFVTLHFHSRPGDRLGRLPSCGGPMHLDYQRDTDPPHAAEKDLCGAQGRIQWSISP